MQAEYGGFPAGSRALVPRSGAPIGTVEEVKEQVKRDYLSLLFVLFMFFSNTPQMGTNDA